MVDQYYDKWYSGPSASWGTSFDSVITQCVRRAIWEERAGALCAPRLILVHRYLRMGSRLPWRD